MGPLICIGRIRRCVEGERDGGVGVRGGRI